MKKATSYSIQYIRVHLSRSTITEIFVTQNKCRMYSLFDMLLKHVYFIFYASF